MTVVDRVLLAQWDSGGRGFVRTRLWLTWFCQGNGTVEDGAEFCQGSRTVVDEVLSGQQDSGGQGFVGAMGQWCTRLWTGQWRTRFCQGNGVVEDEVWPRQGGSGGRDLAKATGQWRTRFGQGNGTLEDEVWPRQRDSGGRGFAKAMVERTEQVGSVGTWEEAATATGGR